MKTTENKDNVYFRQASYGKNGFSSYVEFSIGEGINHIDFTIENGMLACRVSTSEGHQLVDFATIHSAICRVLDSKDSLPKTTLTRKTRFVRKIE